jgi:hypothetical protein
MAGPSINNKSLMGTFDSERIFHEKRECRGMEVDSDDLPPNPMTPEPFFQQLLKRMNPTECISPATDAVTACGVAAYKACVASEREELEWLLTNLLKDIRRAHKTRSSALHRLYRLTDREHAHNR